MLIRFTFLKVLMLFWISFDTLEIPHDFIKFLAQFHYMNSHFTLPIHLDDIIELNTKAYMTLPLNVLETK